MAAKRMTPSSQSSDPNRAAEFDEDAGPPTLPAQSGDVFRPEDSSVAAQNTTAVKAKALAPNISPLRVAAVDEWAATKVSGWQAEALVEIRALVARHAPRAKVSIKWGQPVWEENGPFAWARPAAKHLSFGFWRGADLQDPDGHLQGDGDRMRHVKLASLEDLSTLPLESYVKQAVALNATNGSPTKRSG